GRPDADAAPFARWRSRPWPDMLRPPRPTATQRKGHPMTKTALLAAAAILIPSLARADELFVISGTSNGTPITPVGASNLIDLVNSAVNNQGQFAGLPNTDA